RRRRRAESRSGVAWSSSREPRRAVKAEAVRVHHEGRALCRAVALRSVEDRGEDTTGAAPDLAARRPVGRSQALDAVEAAAVGVGVLIAERLASTLSGEAQRSDGVRTGAADDAALRAAGRMLNALRSPVARALGVRRELVALGAARRRRRARQRRQ